MLQNHRSSQPPLAPHRLRRVLLLTDGRANLGPRDPGVLARAVGRALTTGVTTSTVGVGRHYDERHLEELAGAGDGNYHYAAEASELEGLFLTELAGLKATTGRLVSLGVRGVEVVDVLNDFPRLPNGRLALPPLRAGRTLEVLLRVTAKAGDRLRLRLAWTDPAGVRQVERPNITFGAAPPGVLHEDDPEVIRVRGLLEVARLQRQVAELADRGDVTGAFIRVEEAREHLTRLSSLRLNVEEDLTQLDALRRGLERGDREATSKLARSRAYHKTTGRE